jgi:hypothetical protein
LSANDRRLMLETNAVKLLRSLLLEITDDEDATRDTIEGETNIQDAIRGALKDMREDQMLLNGLETTIEELVARFNRLNARQDRRREAIQKAMELAEQEKLTFPEATLSLRKSPDKIVVIEEDKIPTEYFDPQPPKLNKSRLAEALKSGKSVTGAVKSNGGRNLSIRRS